jgi:hypothetical protein
LPKVSPIRDQDGQRRRAEFTKLVHDGEVRGPELPESTEWPEETRALYDAIRRDAIAQALTEADWRHVIDTMALHRLMWVNEPSNAIKVAAEVRLRLAQLGVTPESRLRLRMLIAEPTEQTSPNEDRLRANRERKQRLMKLIEPSDERTSE